MARTSAGARRWLAALALACAAGAAHAVDITGAGASFPFPLYANWAHSYHAETGDVVNYQSIGSGGGVAQISKPTVDFGATDAPLSGEELDRLGLVQFPALLGGVVPVVHIPGIEPGQLKLSGSELADIFLGRITRWNDPTLTARNPGLTLPDAEILVVHRSDGSGTTYNWTHYLAQVSPAWQETVGVGKAVKWPAGQGGKGNEGVANYVRQLRHTIGYVEYGYARENDLSHVALENSAGNVVQPDAASFAAAAASADWDAVPGMGLTLTNQPGADAWPLAAATFILVPRTTNRPASTRAALAFFDWAFRHGDQMAEDMHYVALPDALTDRVRAVWARDVRDRDGKPVWP
ncbi:phosphate ABC transporter substrate-binding protein PstS [Verticiella sediminum]|uniref:Phosphate-binding protein PstS n=1 Tax=Verticiella sediminum TaxID=1247510 RepID=A0A556A9B9_9BURK|nr:phosphate ABC transporter substrate-binding protein PstS [Verticiella sediminum]TSH89470.1 phosphate ABC transporter substrate-binding protein PstS [Verticiella sediminum]